MKSGTARDDYVAGIDQRFAPLVLELDRAVRAGSPGLDAAIKYRMLTYGVGGDFRHWVCAVDVRKDRVCLRFLRGRLLAAPAGLLRPGSTTMGNIDLVSVDDVDGAVIAALVKEAVDRLDEFRTAYSDARK